MFRIGKRIKIILEKYLIKICENICKKLANFKEILKDFVVNFQLTLQMVEKIYKIWKYFGKF